MTSGESDDAARWREAAGLRGEHPRWVIVWLASTGVFRAYRRLPGTRRDTALSDPSAAGLASQITRAEQAARTPSAPAATATQTDSGGDQPPP